MKRRAEPAPLPSLPAQILDLPRVLRIIIVMLFSVGLTLLLVPLLFPPEFFITAENGVVPAIVSVIAGMVMYAIGWRLMIGFIGERLPERRAVLLYFMVGLVILLLGFTLIVFGAVMGTEL